MIKPGKAGRPHTAQTHHTMTPPQTPLKRRAQRVALAEVSQYRPTAKARKTPLLAGQKK
jgi:hypothetical protein